MACGCPVAASRAGLAARGLRRRGRALRPGRPGRDRGRGARGARPRRRSCASRGSLRAGSLHLGGERPGARAGLRRRSADVRTARSCRRPARARSPRRGRAPRRAGRPRVDRPPAAGVDGVVEEQVAAGADRGRPAVEVGARALVRVVAVEEDEVARRRRLLGRACVGDEEPHAVCDPEPLRARRSARGRAPRRVGPSRPCRCRSYDQSSEPSAIAAAIMTVLPPL